MEKQFKKTILVDLDGVLNTYNGNFDENYIPPIREGAYDFLMRLSEKYNILIFTSRNLLLASKWLIENNLDGFVNNVTNIKEPCSVILDDRCVNFSGNYHDTEREIKEFKTWYKKM